MQFVSQTHCPASHAVPSVQPASEPQVQLPDESQPSPIPAQLRQAWPAAAQARADSVWHWLFWQQPEGQLVAPHAQAPLTQASPELHGALDPQVQPPSEAQVSDSLPHWKQLDPPTPHWVASTFVMHAPASLQQPVQLLGSQTQVPPWQT